MPYIFFYIIQLVLLLYFVLIVFYLSNWKKKFNIRHSKSFSDNPFVSIVIVGRNEAENIQKCINSISSNDFPKEKYEIIYIDDYSTDNSLQILKSLQISNLKYYELKDYSKNRIKNNYKKIGLKYAVSKAKGEIILQTDADTIVGKKWIALHSSQYLDSKTNFVTAPILYKSKNNFIEAFQKYDILVTTGVTASGIISRLHYMANGANMSYRKKLLSKYNLNNKFASGDDMFLIQNISKDYPKSIKYLKEKNAAVYTYPEATLKSLFSQRLRWATKTSSYNDIGLKAVIFLVFTTNLSLIVIPFLLLFLGKSYSFILLLLVILKLFIDIIFTKSIAKTFDENTDFNKLIFTFFSYPFYIIYIGIKSLVIKKYNWKGRIVE